MSLLGFDLRAGSIGRVIRTYDLVFLIALLWFMVQFLRFVFPPLFGTFQDVYGVSNTQTGLLFTLLMLGYSAMQFPGGLLADRIHEVTVMVGGAVLFTAAAVFASFAPTFTLLTIAAVAIGIGTGVHKTVAIAYLSRIYPERTGLSLGIMDTVGQFGGMIAPIAVVALLGSDLPWESVFFIGAVVTVVLASGLWVRGRLHRDDHAHDGNSPEENEVKDDAATESTVLETDDNELDDEPDSLSYMTIFSDRKLLLFLCVTMLFTFSWNGLSAFFPLFLTDEKGLSSGMAGIAYSLLFAASVSQTVTGGASDKVGKLAISIMLFGIMIVGLTALLVTDSVLLILGLTVITGVGFHGFRPVRDSYLMKLIPSSIGGGTLGIVRTFMTGVGALAPAVIGYLSDVLGYSVAFCLIVGMLSAGGICIAVLR